MVSYPSSKSILLHIIILVGIVKVVTTSPMGSKLLPQLLQNYTKLSRPVATESDKVTVTIGLAVMQILEVNEKAQILTTNIWMQLHWTDINLTWNSSLFGDLKTTWLPLTKIWAPDIVLFNSADGESLSGWQEKVTVNVTSNGKITANVPPMVLKSSCRMDVTWFPFDEQRCELKFLTWTFNGFQVDLQLDGIDWTSISDVYVDNGEWSLGQVKATRDEHYYLCCPEPIVTATYSLHLKRRSRYYFFNLLVPCALIGFLALLGFTLPPDSGEKLTLGVTVLFSLIVFLNMIAESMPANSDGLPLLGTYFNCVMVFIASSVMSTVVINLNLRVSPPSKKMGWLWRKFLLNWLPWFLRMDTPPDIRSEYTEIKICPGRDTEGALESVSIAMDPELSNSIGAEQLLQISKGRVEINGRIEKEWKFGAAVVDRLCFLMSLGVAIGSTVALIISASQN